MGQGGPAARLGAAWCGAGVCNCDPRSREQSRPSVYASAPTQLGTEPSLPDPFHPPPDPPLLDPPRSPNKERIPHGMIFACFMVSSMVGSALAGRLLSNNSK